MKKIRSQPQEPLPPISPGEHLLRHLIDQQMAQVDLATILGKSPNYVQDIIKRRKALDIRLAFELEEALGIPAGQWLDWELEYQRHLHELEAKDQSILKRKDVMARYPFALDAVKFGWVNDEKDPEMLLSNIESFLAKGKKGGEFYLNYRVSGALETVRDSLTAWTVRCFDEAARQRETRSFPRYDRKNLATVIVPQLQNCMYDETDVLKVSGILASGGIAFVIVPSVRKAPVDGIAVYNDGKPFVALSLRHGQLDRFWFVLMHELAHLACDHRAEDIEFNTYEQRSGTTKEEVEADTLASDWILGSRVVSQFASSKKLTLDNVRQFAEAVKRHPAIVLGRLKREGYLDWATHAREHPSVRDNLASIMHH